MPPLTPRIPFVDALRPPLRRPVILFQARQDRRQQEQPMLVQCWARVAHGGPP